ncbi:aspartate kinase [Desulfoplanes sp.]
MRILVQKFGGTSVDGRECMLKVKQKVLDGLDKGYKVIVVLSAMHGMTNSLLKTAASWTKHPDQAELDVLVSTGEQQSVSLFTMLLKEDGIEARSCLGHQLPIRTDPTYGSARILDIEQEKIHDLLERYDVLVVAGFQGCDYTQRITTLGRGGSDTSAVALAAASGAELCEIYTDVEGVFTTDPNICSRARKIDTIDYEEMLEMASMGAKVLQIRSVEFAKKFNVPIHVRSTFSNEPGTIVTQEENSMEAALVSGIAYDKDQARITLVGVNDEPGVSARIFEPIAAANIVVDMIVQNPSKDDRTDLTFTVPRGSVRDTLAILERLKEDIGALHIFHDDNVCKISIIGVGMRTHAGIASIAFATLKKENINILMISTSEIKISCLVKEKYTELAIRSLHEAFGLDKEISPACEQPLA